MRKYFQSIFTITGILLILFSSCSKSSGGSVTPTPTPTPTPAPATGKSYYVSVSGSDGNTGTSVSAPLQTITAGNNKVAAGDTVFIMNGTYTQAINVTKSGTDIANITFKAYPGHSPKIYISGEIWNAFTINGNYIVLDGIELYGDNANITYAEAYAAFNLAVAGGTPQGKYNTNGINIGGSGTQSKFPHHVVISNCKVHDFPGGGISSIQADYTTIEGNAVYNNAWYMMYGGSGISILTPSNSDATDVTKYKNIIRNNYVYGNKTTIPWIGITPNRLSDGNGIIIDINQTGYNGVGAGFGGRTLVENNVSFNNGGSGIHTFKADHVDIINNTVYGNGVIMTDYADVFANNSTDVKIMNNIMYSRTGGKVNAAPKAGTIVSFDYNIYFNGTIGVQGTHDKILDPQFINASIDGTIANFVLKSSSPGIDAGTTSIYSAKDIKGIARPKGAGVDCGAYEVQ